MERCRGEVEGLAGVKWESVQGRDRKLCRGEDRRACRGEVGGEHALRDEVGDVVQWMWGRACFAVWRWEKSQGWRWVRFAGVRLQHLTGSDGVEVGVLFSGDLGRLYSRSRGRGRRVFPGVRLECLQR